MRSFEMHRVEGKRFHSHEVADLRVAQIEEHVDALRRRDEDALAAHRRRQQPAVIADQRERHECALRGAKREQQRARVRRVEHAEPVDSRIDVEIGALRAVDVEIGAEEAMRHVVGRGGVGARAAILQEQRNFAAAGYEVERRAQRPFVVVLDHDRAIEAAVGLRGRKTVRMRVIPIHAAAVAHLEIVRVAPSRLHEERPIAVVVAVDGRAVPMDDRRLRQCIDEVDPHALSALQHERWIRVTAPARARRVPERTAGRGGACATCRAREQRQRRGARREATQISIVPVASTSAAARSPDSQKPVEAASVLPARGPRPGA